MATALVDFERYKTLQKLILASLEKQLDNEYFNYSKMWKGILSHREPAHQLSELLIILNDLSSGADGVTGKVSDEKKELFVSYYKTFLSTKEIDELPQSWLGSPSILDFDGYPVSVPYLQNLLLFLELRQMLVSEKGPNFKGLNIVEIGAGYGGLAYFLLQSGIAASYTVVDLPENLKINSFYLTQNFQNLDFQVLESSSSAPSNKRKPLNFLTPGNILSIADWKFDLAVNSDSLGEMPAQTAKAYIQWLYQHLNEGGLFFTKNGHNRGPDCIQFPREYGYQTFQISRLRPPSMLSSLFDDFSHYALLKKHSALKKNYNENYLDALCALFALGLQGELTEISQAFAEGNLTTEMIQFLDLSHQFFAAPRPKEKIALLEGASSNSYSSVLCYLRGITWFLMGNLERSSQLLMDYLPSCQSYIAEAYSVMVLSHQDKIRLQGPFRFGAQTRYAIDELLIFDGYRFPLNKFAFRLRADALRKKIFYPSVYTPTSLLKTKNLVFNVKEGKGFSTVR